MKNTKVFAGIKRNKMGFKRRRPAPPPQSARECPVRATPAETRESERQSRTDNQGDTKQISAWLWLSISRRGRLASSDGNGNHIEQPRWCVSSPAACR